MDSRARSQQQRGRLFAVTLLLLTLGYTMAAGSHNVSNIIESHRQEIVAVLTSKGLKPRDYKLSLLGQWDNDRLPIIVADPAEAYFEQRIMVYFAVFPDGTLVSEYEFPLERILAAVFSDVSKEDAAKIAKLATLFGNFKASVGFLTDFVRPGVADPQAMPRPDTKVHLRRDGAVMIVEFYTYQALRSQLYDCSVRIEGGHVQLAARLLPPPTMPK
jgi:hypothetical protein